MHMYCASTLTVSVQLKRTQELTDSREADLHKLVYSVPTCTCTYMCVCLYVYTYMYMYIVCSQGWAPIHFVFACLYC